MIALPPNPFPMKAAAVVLCLVSARLSALPLPEVRVVTTDYHGVKVEDPYRYFEERGPEVMAWAKAVSDATVAELAAVPERGKIAGLILAANKVQGDRVSWVHQPRPDHFYFLMRREADEVELLFHQKPGGKPEMILDPRKLVDGGGAPVTIKYMSVSPDLKWIGVGITSGGDEDSDLYVMDLATMKVVEGPYDRARWGYPQWLPDSSGFFFKRLQKLAPGADPLQKFQKGLVYLHRLGADVARDPVVFGYGVHPDVAVKSEDIVSLSLLSDSGWVIASNETGVSADCIYHAARLEDVLAGKPGWRHLTDRSDLAGAMGSESLAVHGGALFMISRKDAPNGRVVRMDLAGGGKGEMTAVYAAPSGTVQDLVGAKDGLYVRVLDGGPSRLVRLRWEAMDQPEEIAMPRSGGISLHGGNGVYPYGPGVDLTLSSWTGPPRKLRVKEEASIAVPLDLPQPAAPPISARLTSRETFMKGHDGVDIPVSIIHRTDLDPAKPHPTLVFGYGAYGINLEPRFSPSDAALYEMGAIKVVAHLRGGGELGDAWRLAGYQKTKPNTWKDMISVAEGLAALGLTTPRQTCIQGGSAGGITVGRALTEKPEAFGAVLGGVGLFNTLRAEDSPNGIPKYPGVRHGEEQARLRGAV